MSESLDLQEASEWTNSPDANIVPKQQNPLALTSGGPAYWCNWPLVTAEDKKLVLRCHQDSDIKPDALIGKELLLSRILLHPVEITDPESGEVFDTVRTVLINPNGQTTAFVSVGIRKSLTLLAQMFGTGPWNPPLRVSLRQIATRLGRRTYTLDLVDVPVPPAPQRKRK